MATEAQQDATLAAASTQARTEAKPRNDLILAPERGVDIANRLAGLATFITTGIQIEGVSPYDVKALQHQCAEYILLPHAYRSTLERHGQQAVLAQAALRVNDVVKTYKTPEYKYKAPTPKAQEYLVLAAARDAMLAYYEQQVNPPDASSAIEPALAPRLQPVSTTAAMVMPALTTAHEPASQTTSAVKTPSTHALEDLMTQAASLTPTVGDQAAHGTQLEGLFAQPQTPARPAHTVARPVVRATTLPETDSTHTITLGGNHHSLTVQAHRIWHTAQEQGLLKEGESSTLREGIEPSSRSTDLLMFLVRKYGELFPQPGKVSIAPSISVEENASFSTRAEAFNTIVNHAFELFRQTYGSQRQIDRIRNRDLRTELNRVLGFARAEFNLVGAAPRDIMEAVRQNLLIKNAARLGVLEARLQALGPIQDPHSSSATPLADHLPHSPRLTIDVNGQSYTFQPREDVPLDWDLVTRRLREHLASGDTFPADGLHVFPERIQTEQLSRALAIVRAAAQPVFAATSAALTAEPVLTAPALPRAEARLDELHNTYPAPPVVHKYTRIPMRRHRSLKVRLPIGVDRTRTITRAANRHIKSHLSTLLLAHYKAARHQPYTISQSALDQTLFTMQQETESRGIYLVPQNAAPARPKTGPFIRPATQFDGPDPKLAPSSGVVHPRRSAVRYWTDEERRAHAELAAQAKPLFS